MTITTIADLQDILAECIAAGLSARLLEENWIDASIRMAPRVVVDMQRRGADRIYRIGDARPLSVLQDAKDERRRWKSHQRESADLLAIERDIAR